MRTRTCVTMGLALTLSATSTGCANRCDRIKAEAKAISAESFELAQGDEFAILDPAKQEKIQELTRRAMALQNDAIQADCPLDGILN